MMGNALLVIGVGMVAFGLWTWLACWVSWKIEEATNDRIPGVISFLGIISLGFILLGAMLR